MMDRERQRLRDRQDGVNPWRLWGPYLSERQWGTVREDYSPHGNAWEAVSHDAARSRAYRWGEDGIGGISDDQQRLCFSVAMWNGRDPILKERLFGLTGNEGNHGEDVKELYYYLDATPTHSYLRMLYKYPQREFPYSWLVDGNRSRGKLERELEILDTNAFDEDRYFDVFIEYAKNTPDDLGIRIRVHNRGPERAGIDVIPQLWFRNTWSWGYDATRPQLRAAGNRITASHKELGEYDLTFEGEPELLFCDNETNVERLFGGPRDGRFVKDAFHEAIVRGNREAVNPDGEGTKAGLRYRLALDAGESATVLLRLARRGVPEIESGRLFADRIAEADAFYAAMQDGLDEDRKLVQRQAFAGMVWSKQFYYLDIPQWLNGDPGQPAPPAQRKTGRNSGWEHLNNADVISMPDKWEYPWYAAWDLAFHCVTLAEIDAEFAKDQLLLMTREWYMHPNGQLPAYEWAFGDVNPPVHAWATWRVFEIDRAQRGDAGDLDFLERVFHKLCLNFTWWVNRKDAEGKNVFQGGFLGLDNIGVFDRSAPLPTGGHLEQADGTSWMAMYSLNLMRIALELSKRSHVYQDLATKFFEHFLHIAAAMTKVGDSDLSLWNEEDEFFYDVLHTPHGVTSLKVRSMVGLVPLFAVEILDADLLAQNPDFEERLRWFLNYRPDLAALVSRWNVPGEGSVHLLSLLRGHRMKRLLKRMLDETEFLSDYGVRALSRYHHEHPYELEADGGRFTVSYQPGESESGLFGGNSNWRGPIWMPVNFLLVESLRRFHSYYGDDFKVECPTGSGTLLTIGEIADELSRRLTNLFLRDARGRRAVFGNDERLQNDPQFRDYVLFHEYFHGDDGSGVGASHQTGWTGLVASLIATSGRSHESSRSDSRAEELGASAGRAEAVAG